MANTDTILEKVYNLVAQIEEGKHKNVADELQEKFRIAGINDKISLSILEMHVIDYIGKTGGTNAISIAKSLNVTRGGISKLSQRLIREGFIEAGHRDGNKRDIFYRLTPLGEKIYTIHALLHKKVENSLRCMIDTYNNTEQEIIMKFLEDLSKTV